MTYMCWGFGEIFWLHIRRNKVQLFHLTQFPRTHAVYQKQSHTSWCCVHLLLCLLPFYSISAVIFTSPQSTPTPQGRFICPYQTSLTWTFQHRFSWPVLLRSGLLQATHMSQTLRSIASSFPSFLSFFRSPAQSFLDKTHLLTHRRLALYHTPKRNAFLSAIRLIGVPNPKHLIQGSCWPLGNTNSRTATFSFGKRIVRQKLSAVPAVCPIE